MPVQVRADTENLQAVGRAMRKAPKELKREMYKAVRRGVRNAKPEVQKSAMEMLPKRGGLNKWTAALTVTAKQRYSGSDPSITVVGQRNRGGRKSDMKRMNAGVTAHPVFGRYTDKGDAHGMFLQNVPPGFFDKAITGPVLDLVQREVAKALDETIRKLF